MSEQPDTSPKAAPEIHVNDDWKLQAEKEKEQLAEKVGDIPAAAEKAASGAQPATGEPTRGTLPPASFDLLVEQYATQILIALGQLPDGSGKVRARDPDLARLYIDLLGIIQEKSKGNLSAEEENLIGGALYQMRMAFVTAQRKPSA